MKTFSKIMIALCSMAAVAVAQPAPAKPAPTPAPAAGKTAPAVPAKEAKPAAGAPATAPVPPKAEPPAMPKPPAEIAASLKTMQGTWKCTGSMTGPDGQPVAMKSTQKTKGDLDGWWIQDSYEGTMGKAKFRFVAYTTYDATAKKWRRVFIDNTGGQMIGTSDGVKDGKLDYNLDSMGPMGGGQFRDHTDLTDPKALKTWGEMSMDKGKTWMKVYEMTCKK
ncbi:MAG: DUF1579 family protein [Kofleriaceae bacterium]|nr:DUF1579 family protein [Kofleriaceae bacterium]